MIGSTFKVHIYGHLYRVIVQKQTDSYIQGDYQYYDADARSWNPRIIPKGTFFFTKIRKLELTHKHFVV